MLQNLALDERPATWAELLGQETSKTILLNSIRAKTISPGYALLGESGTGKTSSSILLAKSLNCLDRQDVEPCNACRNCKGIDERYSANWKYVDGSSDKSIDFVRNEIMPFLRSAPVAGNYRVLVIDEVHMYTEQAISPFLTYLENPSPTSVLIFCTTEEKKLKKTIKDRCMTLFFNKLSHEAITGRLVQVTGEDPVALAQLVKECGGSFRGVWAALDKWAKVGKPLTVDSVYELVGSVPDREREVLWKDLAANNLSGVAGRWRSWAAKGMAMDKIGQHLMDDLIAMIAANPDPTFQKPLALLAGAAILPQDAWLPTLLLMGGFPYQFTAQALPVPPPVVAEPTRQFTRIVESRPLDPKDWDAVRKALLSEKPHAS